MYNNNNNNNSKDSVYVEQSSLLAHGCHWLMQVGYDKWLVDWLS